MNVRTTSVAAKKLLSPACDAVIVHVPGPTRLTPPPDTEHTDVSPDVNVTVRPDDDVGATGIGASPYVAPLGAGFVNVIVCAAFATVTDAGTVVFAPSYVPSDATLAEIEHDSIKSEG